MTEKISIIVPIYNVEKYLHKCIDSILGQTYKNIEVILVDDGSPDRCGEICDEYAEKDPRVKVIHKKNGGLSDARNAGLDVASGLYLTFIDSDDFISNDYLEYLLSLIHRGENIQIAMLPAQQLCEGENPKDSDNIHEIVVSQEEAIRKMLLRQGISHSSWGKLFVSGLWKELRFPVGQNYEDLATTYHIASQAENVAISNALKYYYVQRSGSIMHEICNERTLRVLDVMDSVSIFLFERCPSCKTEVLNLKMATYLKCWQSILNVSLNAYPEYQDRISRFVKSYGPKLVVTKGIRRKDRVKILLALLGKRIFITVYNRFDGTKK